MGAAALGESARTGVTDVFVSGDGKAAGSREGKVATGAGGLAKTKFASGMGAAALDVAAAADLADVLKAIDAVDCRRSG